jgi:prepilin-type N-terminal cleavage/methylation domain-containing protein
MTIHQFKNSIIRAGFTLVELMIVIFVIAIIAAIVIVSYNNVTNTSNDTAVKTDLAGLATQVKLFFNENDRYPVNSTEISNLGIRVTKETYSTTSANNMVFCYRAGGAVYGVLAGSKSGQSYYINHLNPDPKPIAQTHAASGSVICPAIGVSSPGWAWLYAGGSWQSYIGG